MDPIPRLEAVIEAVRSLPNRPDAVLVSGDLTDDGAEAGYRLAREMLDRLEVPLHVIPGNHDDRARLREAFGLPGRGTSRSTTRWRSASCGSSPSTRSSPVRTRATFRPSNCAGSTRSWRPSRRRRPCWPCTTRRLPPVLPSGTRSTSWRHSARRWPASSPAIRGCGRSPAATCTGSPLRPWQAARFSLRPAPTGRCAPTSRRRIGIGWSTPRLRDPRAARRRALLAGGVGPVQPLTGLGSSCSCTKRTTAAPSPTAIAQRLIEPARTSPAA